MIRILERGRLCTASDIGVIGHYDELSLFAEGNAEAARMILGGQMGDVPSGISRQLKYDLPE